jgi:hypothetical protein
MSGGNARDSKTSSSETRLVCVRVPLGTVGAPIDERSSAVGEQRTQQPDSEDNALQENPEDESLVEKAKDKLTELVEEPEAGEHDEGKTNPVTGMRRN